jgi:hypothetical protein
MVLNPDQAVCELCMDYITDFSPCGAPNQLTQTHNRAKLIDEPRRQTNKRLEWNSFECQMNDCTIDTSRRRSIVDTDAVGFACRHRSEIIDTDE